MREGIAENKKTKYLTVNRITRIAVVTAVLCILAPLSIPIPISPVPLSLTNLVIFLSVFILEWKSASISVLLYLLIGLVGLPVFSGFSGGPAKLAGPTGGYLIGFIALVLIDGLMTDKAEGKYRYIKYILGMLIGEAVMYVFGTFWLAYQMELSFGQALFMGVIPYLPFDGAKMVLALIIGPQVKKLLIRSFGRL